jgi:HEAT repeat protein
MATLEEVRKLLGIDEFDYVELAHQLGPEVVPLLKQLVKEDDPRIAPNAAYLASLFDTSEAAEVVGIAATSRHDVTRVSAAAALSNAVAANIDTKVIMDLLRDQDVAVRARTIKAAGNRTDSAIKIRLQEIMNVDPVLEIRSITAKVLNVPNP